MSYIGALGASSFKDEIDDAVDTLASSIAIDINNTSNYVWTTSNILIGRIKDTSNYADRLDLRIKALEGTEGSPGDINLGIPAIPSTGLIALAGSIALATGACIMGNGITALSLIEFLEAKVNSNKEQADKIGGWSSNYSDKVGVWGSNYTDLVGKYTSNYADKVGIWGSNYTDLVGKYTSNYADKVGIWGSNYSDKVGIWGSNYSDKVGIWSSNYTDKIGIFGSNYTDKVGIFGSNYTDKIGIFGSNYTDKVGIFGSNYIDKIGIFGSNYTDKVGIFGSNYTDKIGIFGSNYARDKIGVYSSNYSELLGIFGSNYARDKIGVYSSNYSELLGIFGSNYARDKIGVYSSNYTDLQVLYTSNYVARINTSINTGKQDIINSIANQIIIGNGNGLTTTSTGLTFATNTLNANNLSISGITTLTGNVGIGTTASTPLHIYNATSSLLRLQTGTSGKPSIEFSVGTLTDTITDYRIINDAYELKFQYQDNLVSYGGVGSDIMIINDKGTTYNKPTYYVSGLGVKTPADPLYSLDVSGNCRYLSGNVGIGVEPSTGASAYRLNVAGSVNIEGIGKMFYVNNLPVVSSQWATSGTTIEYNGGSVGIGTSALSYKLNVNGSINATSLLVNGSAIDYNSLNNKPITLVPTTTNLQLASGYNFLVGGNVGIGTTNSATYKVDVLGDINCSGAFRIGGVPFVGWFAGTPSTNIYYSAGNVGIGTSATPTALLELTKTTIGTNDLLNMRYDTRNGIRVSQTYVGVDDVRYDLIQKVANVDKTVSLTLYNGFVGIGTTNATRILQVGTGGRLAIANSSSDFSQIGTNEGGAPYNTRIVVCGYNNFLGAPYNNNGSIIYVATNTGCHIFLTQTAPSGGETERLRIGNNGNVSIGTTDTSTYKLNVAGDVNISGAFRVGGVALANSWSASGTNIYYNAGNVGIGHSAPIGPLCVGNSSVAGSDGFILIGKNNGGGGTRHQRIGYNANFDLVIGDAGSGTLGTWIEAFKLSYASPANALVVNGNGYVGIGTTPSYKCHIKTTYDNVATGLHLDADDGSNDPNKYALTIWAFVIGGGQVGYRFRTQSYSGGANTPLEFRHDGSIHFQVDRWHRGNDSKDRLYFANANCTYIKSGQLLSRQIEFRSSGDIAVGYFDGNVFYCYGPINISDRRIKRDIVEINDETALNMILQVQPTTYYYRDEARNRGNGKVYGFIAQQIKEVIPDAVHTTQEIIANIYKTCLVYNKREIYHTIPQDVAIDTEVQIFDKEGGEKGKRYKIKEIYDDYFVIDEDIEGDDCFVFGYMVYDLNGLDKSYIYTLNVCATQELHRRIEAQKVIIQSQDDRIKELEAKVERLLNYISI